MAFASQPNSYSTKNPSALVVSTTNVVQLQFEAGGRLESSDQSNLYGRRGFACVTDQPLHCGRELADAGQHGVWHGFLGSNQLDATAITPGVFNYQPTNGAILNPGTNMLSVTFTPNDSVNYGGPSTTNVALVVMAAPPLLQAARPSGNVISFTWNAAPGQMYQVQYTTNLTLNTWSNLGGPILSTNATAATSDTVSNFQKFYRVTALP